MSPTDLMSPDLVKFVFIFGMVLSVFLYERSHLTTGSIVVPGFLGIHVFEPGIIFVSLFNAWMCFFVVHQVLPRFCIMKTKSKFYALIVVSVLLQLSVAIISRLPIELAFAGEALLGFGYVIPGLIAHDMNRNGAVKTSVHTLFVSYIIGGIVLGFAILAPAISLNPQPLDLTPIGFNLPLVLVLSTLGAIVLKLQTPVRSGGYITAAYLVFFGLEPLVIGVIFLVALVNYFISCRLLQPTMIVFGRRKFALVLIVGSLLMWSATLLLSSQGIQIFLANHPSYAGVIILLPGLIANDIQRSNVSRVFIGLGLLASWVFVLATLFYEIKLYARPEYVFPLIGSLCGMLLVIFFFKQPTSLPLPAQTSLADTTSLLSYLEQQKT